MESPCVTAVVTTYRRPETLRRCLHALASQERLPDRVVIVDNGDDSGTEVVLRSFETLQGRVLNPGANLGPGGGFARGMAAALESDPDWLWVMDDDVEPQGGALAHLVAATAPDRDAALYWPTVIGPGGTASSCPGWWGVLIPASAVRRYGPPREDYVWWGEDSEYLQWRLPTLGEMRSVRVTEARVHHRHSSRGAAPPPWKLYYTVRNEIHLRIHLKRYNYWKLLRVGAWAAKHVLSHPSRMERLRCAALGAFDGLFGRLGRRIDIQ